MRGDLWQPPTVDPTLVGWLEVSAGRLGRLDRHRALEAALELELGQLDLAAQVEAAAGVAADKRRQRPVGEVVALQADVAEHDDLGQEGVGPHEAGDVVAERVLLVVGQGVEPMFNTPPPPPAGGRLGECNSVSPVIQ